MRSRRRKSRSESTRIATPYKSRGLGYTGQARISANTQPPTFVGGCCSTFRVFSLLIVGCAHALGGLGQIAKFDTDTDWPTGTTVDYSE